MQENKQEKSQIKQNILLFLDKKGVSPYEFYKISGVTRGVLSQNNGISEDNLARFLAYAPEVSTEWLLTGNGSMLKESIHEPKCDPPTPHSDPPEVPQGASDTTIAQLLAKITEQAETIGALKEQIKQLQREKGKDVSDVRTSGVANVG